MEVFALEFNVKDDIFFEMSDDFIFVCKRTASRTCHWQQVKETSTIEFIWDLRVWYEALITMNTANIKGILKKINLDQVNEQIQHNRKVEN